MIYWVYLLVASCFEISWTFFLQRQQYILYALMMFCCMFFTSLASRGLPMNIIYIVVIGIGTAGTTLLNIFAFKYPFSLLHFFLIANILLSVVWLNQIS